MSLLSRFAVLMATVPLVLCNTALGQDALMENLLRQRQVSQDSPSSLIMDPRLAEADQLERSGQRLRTTGIVLGVVGVGLIGLSGYLFWASGQEKDRCERPGATGCSDFPGLGGVVGGVFSALTGVPMVFAGAFTAEAGKSRMEKARGLRHSAVAVMPSVAPVPGGAMVGLRIIHF